VEETVAVVAERYRNQVSTYAAAMEKICRKPVKQALLYFFHLRRFVAIEK
jgi:ATP-dependent exoDNAse (exonuclease V) beta subunit